MVNTAMNTLCIRKRGVWLVLSVLLLAGATAQAADPPPMIAVSPSRFELELGSTPSVQSLRVFNFGKQPVEVQVNLATWDLDEQNQVRLVEPDEQSLDQWIVINPLSFTIPPGKSQSVRFSVRPRVRPVPGEHRAMIYFDQVLSESDGEQQMRVKFRVGVAVYGTVGELKRNGVLHAVEPEKGSNPVKVGLQISSTGTAHVRIDGHYSIWPATAYPGLTSEVRDFTLDVPDDVLPEAVLQAAVLPGVPVLPGDCRRIWVTAGQPLPAGEYILDLDFALGDNEYDRALPFTVLPEAESIDSPESE
jgi:hypothetical protein